ncbi:unnamed protein product [Blepharisma stoltei]|uniref:GH16 domain-containing protein n=1 Tax=Blepharisma stoltei TaxID=1481888 RepID=A0AAU9IW20_9CILI|nr:unnamed protein product [Blepharisma stoltei]
MHFIRVFYWKFYKIRKMVKQIILFTVLISGVFSGYVNVMNDTFQDMSNWIENVMAGADSGNNDWEYYTDTPTNVFITKINGQNALVLRAVAQNYKGYNYTSGKVNSVRPWGPYGFFNVKAVVPKGSALWPAIFMMPPNAQSVYGGWAACGEIDIMETICSNSSGYSTLHFGGVWPNNVQYPVFPSNAYPFEVTWNQPHWYGVEWQQTYMNIWLDAQMINGSIQGGKLINHINSSQWYSLNSNGQKYPGNAPYNQPFNIIFDLAVGGNWPCSFPGCCDYAAVPAQMEIYNVQIWALTNVEEQL